MAMKRIVNRAEAKIRYETILRRPPPPNDPRPPRAATAIGLTTPTANRPIWIPDFGKRGAEEEAETQVQGV